MFSLSRCINPYYIHADHHQTGFEFKKQRAIPVITGIVVAKGQEDAVMEVGHRGLDSGLRG
jgi:hypothetical protein